MSTTLILLFIAIGVIGGLIGGMLGVGGGILFVPCLHYGFQALGIDADLSIKLAIATSLSIILVTALSAAVSHTMNGAIDPRAVLIMAGMALPSAFVGAGIGHVIGGASLQKLFGFVTLLISSQFLRAVPKRHEKAGREISFNNYVMVGGVSGLFSSILGVGGGIITVPLLHLALQMPMNQAVANSSGLIVFSALAGTIGWILSGLGAEGRPAYSMGYVNLLAWILIASSAMLTSLLGAWLADRLDPNRLRFPFGVLLLIVGFRMAFFG
ncbi:MAG: sulfite exporter TauE/SafE family protein [Candidatus Omnitrophica bacterium]|nr:sulfite exporter TauE/SafE family protein [Candidatus Omnitrophota bacterium]